MRASGNVSFPSVAVNEHFCLREKRGDLEETVVETDPEAGALWLTY